MKFNSIQIIAPALLVLFLSSCNTLEKASIHGLNSGFYKCKSGKENTRNVYLDVSEDQLDVYTVQNDQPDKTQVKSLSLSAPDSIMKQAMVFKKQSLDIDLTSILLKYRPAIHGSKAQLTADLNIALYAGWRFDNYYLRTSTDPIGKTYSRITNRGFDIGLFAGPGTTLVSPFTTQNHVTNDYSGMTIQSGIAAFVESNIASFGLSVGYDYLLNSDREVWIYNKKPWIGFVVGIALN